MQILSAIQGRRQYTLCRSPESEYFPVTSGVPPGSNLGPLLFLLNIDDVRNVASKSHILFNADDTKLYERIDKLHGLHQNYYPLS